MLLLCSVGGFCCCCCWFRGYSLTQQRNIKQKRTRIKTENFFVLFSFPLLNVSMCVCLYVWLYVCLCVRECVKRAEQFQLLRLQSAGKMQTCPGTKRRRRRQRWTGKRVCWKIREWVMEREHADGGCSREQYYSGKCCQSKANKKGNNK